MFAGRLVNEALLRLLGSEGDATESLVATSARLDISALPPFGEQWLEPVADFLGKPDELTPWQQRLPPRLLREELLGPFLTHPVYPRIIVRLRTSHVVTVPDDRLLALSPEFR
jgi:hypothetical protein